MVVVTAAPLRLAAAVLGGLAAAVAAGGLRGPQPVSLGEVERTLLSELVGLISEERHSELEAALNVTYESLPKNAYGHLGHQVVRYVLHRLFVQRHGWFIRGLEPGGDNWHTASSPAVLKEWVPSYLQELLEQRLGEHGINLRELAALAATLEDLIRKEAAERLEVAYQVRGLPLDGHISHEQAQGVLRAYLMGYLGGNLTAATRQEAEQKQARFASKYSNWADAEAWLLKLEAGHLSAHGGQGLDLAATRRVAEKIGEQYGHFNDLECRSLKSTLLAIESRKAGRVTLSDFYSKSLYSHWKFNEKVGYLRALGALDESEPSQPQVILANYVGSRPNCLEATNLYAVCCRNECEDLMGHLEREIAAPTAEPGRIAQLVAALPSDTVKAPRALPAALLQRLDNVAATHGGVVPLHGRLFAQWMHHAFPRECPFPHEAGTTNPQTPDEWMREGGHESSRASEHELQQHVQAGSTPSAAKAAAVEERHAEELPWVHAEELLHRPPPSRGAGRVARLSGLLATVAVALAATQAMRWWGARASKPVLICHSGPATGSGTEAIRAGLALAGVAGAASVAGLLDLTVLLFALVLGLGGLVAWSLLPQHGQLAAKSKLC